MMLDSDGLELSYGTTEVADHAVTLALSLRRGIILQHDYQRSPDPFWGAISAPPAFPLVGTADSGPLIQRPKGRTWGCIGLGRIGTAAALRAKAFGWRVS